MALGAWIDVGRDASVGATNTAAAALGITPERSEPTRIGIGARQLGTAIAAEV
jgi:hypothetical protein